MRTLNSLRKRFYFEQLESRSMLAGNVTVDLIAGNVFVIGSGAANALTITDDGDNLVVTGVPDINGAGTSLSTNTGVSISSGTVAAIAKTAITADVYIHLLYGRDELSIDGHNRNDMLTRSEINVSGGEGNDILTMGASMPNWVVNNLTIDLDEGDDILELDHLYVNASVEDNVTILTGLGRDTITLGAKEPMMIGTVLTGILIDGNLAIDAGFGDDTVNVDRVAAFVNLKIDLEAGNDTLNMGRVNPKGFVESSVQARGNLVIDTSVGHDSVHLDAVLINGNIIVNTYEGDDRVLLGDNPEHDPLLNDQSGPSAGGDFVITTGFGVDNVTVNFTTGVNAFLIDLGPGFAGESSTVVMRNSSFNNDVAILGDSGPNTIDIDALNIITNLFISTSGQNDTIDLKGALVTRGVLTINSGLGSDTVRIDNSLILHAVLFAQAGINNVSVTGNLIDDFFLDLGQDGGSANLSGVAFRRGFARGAANATASGNLFGVGSNLVVEGF
jgi:hypothetical protein